MSIIKPYTFVAGNKARANEVNADFDLLYQQVNANIIDIAENAGDIERLGNNKADINGNSTQRFAVADAVTNTDAVNKQTMRGAIGNSLDIITGLTISKDTNNTIIVDSGSCYDSTKEVVLALANATSKQNGSQGANATYYVYIIGNDTGSSTDVLISSSSVDPALPSGYTLFRQIGKYTTDSNSNINSVSYYGVNYNSDKSNYGISYQLTPDYSTGVSVSSGWVASYNGVVKFHLEHYLIGTGGSGNINNVRVADFRASQGGQGTVDAAEFVVPFKKGDTITFNAWGNGGVASATVYKLTGG